MAKNRPDVTCNIERVIGFVNKKETKVLVMVSWNDGPTRTELRKCWKTDSGELRLGAGIPLDDDEIDELVELFKQRPKPVNFSEVFKSSTGIMEKRQAGFKTEDGFVVLRKRPGYEKRRGDA